MARKLRHPSVFQTFTVAAGATDGDNLVDAVVPSPNCELLQISATQKTAGTGAGTFSLQVKQGETTPTAIGAATATTFVTAAAAAGTIHGQFDINAPVYGFEGKHINISTVKAGVVSANATLIITLMWGL